MKRLHELFSFSFYISGLITYIGRVSWMIYITWIFFFLYVFSTVFLIYFHKQSEEVIKKLLKNIQVTYL